MSEDKLADLTTAEKKRLEKILDERVRPLLRRHDGDVDLIRFTDGELFVRLLGPCSGCPSADLTAEEIVAPPILEGIRAVSRVTLEQGASDYLFQAAKEILAVRRSK